PKKKAVRSEILREATFPQPAAVAITMPRISPIAQPMRQCVVAEKAARFRSCSACACKALDCFHELLALRGRFLRVPRGERIRHAVVHMVVQHPERQALERGVHRCDLGEDVDAITVLLDHPLDSPHLTFDAMEPLHQRLLVVTVLHRASRVLWKRRRRSEFVTTKTLHNATAAAATIGLR